MKNLKLLSKKYFLILLFFLFFELNVQSQEPADIWNIEKKITTEESTIVESIKEKNISQNSVYEMQSKKKNLSNIEEDQTLISKETEIIGLYDPAQNGLNINMWANSNGEQILSLMKKIMQMNLSNDASEILNILLLTNTYYPDRNISKEQFLKIKSDWLIKNLNLQLIENYLINNQKVNQNTILTRYIVDYYLSRSNIEKSCEIFSKIQGTIENEYLSKFNIYCLINNNRLNEAQLLLDLKKELGFEDKFYENKINYIMGYANEPDIEISENTILEFHLSHQTNPNFKFDPTSSTSKKIWRYLSTSNLLENIYDVELTDYEKISTIEKETHEKNYTEKELYNLYKRFQFNINQLLSIKESSKVLSNTEARALIYQGILITTDVDKKLNLINALKNSFKNDNIENAFDQELRGFLEEINIEDIPSNYSTFYEKYINDKKIIISKIKIDNKILHQSKLLNYFKKETLSKNITKDLNNFLKKIKKDRKYFFSKKDVILVEALKSDGIKVSKKYKNLYKINNSEMPYDIQSLIDNNEMGVAVLRLIEVIGQDELKDIDVDTIYFIINTLNQLNIDPLRNKILLKVLPLKV